MGSAFVELQKMFSLTQQDNAMLNEQVMQLSQQVQHERADRTLEPVIQRELEIREERLIQEREHVYPWNGASAGNTGTHAGWPFAGMVKP